MKKNDEIKNRSIDISAKIAEALKLMDHIKKKLLIVFANNQFVSLLSIGDLQRAIINNYPLNTAIGKILRKEFSYATEGESYSSIKERMLKGRAELMPVLDETGNLVKIVLWEEIFDNDMITHRKVDLPVVIMAGGKGTRLKPLTNIIPKPLLPIDDKTIIEHIIDKFVSYGSNQFYISINYKAEMIREYVQDLNSLDCVFNFIQEKMPLGTAGSLHLLKNKINTTFFVTNCDIIVDDDYYEIYDFHIKNKNDITIVSAIRSYFIPYGTLHTEEEGILVSLEEKPELTFQINTGMYILEPKLIKMVPKNRFFHITDLIAEIQARNGRVGVFPVNNNSWKDIGEWNEYLKMINK